MKPAGCAETHCTAQNGGAGEVQLPGFQHDRLVQGRCAEPVIFADENAEQQRLFWNLHFQLPFNRLRRLARAYPSQTAISQVTIDTAIFRNAVCAIPPSSSLNVSRLNVENVV